MGESFLFSVRDDGQIKKLPFMNKDDNEVAHHGSALFLAGAGYDLFVKQFGNQNKFNTSNPGMSYRLPEGIKFGSYEAKSYLAGAPNF